MQGNPHVRFDEGDVETELWCGYLGTARRKGWQQIDQTYRHRATSLLYKRMNSRLFRAIIAAMLVLFFTLLFDYCRYEIEHHPHFDLSRVVYLSIQGVIIGINFVAMLKFVESFKPRA